MKKLAGIIIKFKGVILALFIILTIVSGYFATQVKTNFDIFSYVPKEASSTIAINTMTEEYDQDLPNAEIGIPDLSIIEALEMKKVLAALPYVDEVLWLDDQSDLATPLSLLDKKVVDGFYYDEMALYHVTINDDSKAQDILVELQELVGPDGAVRGQIVEMAFMQRGVTTEMGRIVAFIVPVALLILLFATKSWFEPVLFMIVIFVGVLLNMGSNAIFKDVSFITQAVGSVLQLAVSMDYAIFLLHRFSEYRDEGHTIEDAMKLAIVKSFTPVLSSALTTFFGFLTLIFMRFQIGPDLGIVLAKGVFLSLISVFLLLPVLAVYTYKIIDKTTHKSFLPSFKGLSRLVIRIGIPIIIICALITVPAFLAQRSNYFLYGSQSYPAGSREAVDSARLNEQFGENMQMALLVPKGQWAVEQQLTKDLLQIPEMKSAIGYVTQVGTGIPPDILPDRILSPLISDHYSRLILVAELPAESPETFELAEMVREMVADAYPGGGTHLAGANFVMLDMKTTINQDLFIVNGLAILAIALVIMFAFRSLALPMILVMTIELSIWINLAIPYLTGTPLNFIGYLVISTVQLGATVDYGILMAQHYIDHRQLLSRKEAAMKSVQTVAGSIIPPALILASAGFLLKAISSISVVAELGQVLGAGALISLVMVLFLLPNLLRLFDGFIQKTTWKLQMVPDRHSYRRRRAKVISDLDAIDQEN
ncbi:MAG: MMPL family transporter [Clostridiaceae bacterium]|nr:MMPL family transporter [Clostridiaceae bacterium]